jgi:hypothetical protein
MGRILGQHAGRRMFVGVLALAGLALATCEPLEPAPGPTTPDGVPICPPSDGGGRPPEQTRKAQQRCAGIPIPCAELPRT